MTGSLRVGIMVPHSRQKRVALRLFQQRQARRLKLVVFTPQEIDWERRIVRGHRQMNGRVCSAISQIPRCIVNRCYLDTANTLERLSTLSDAPYVFNRTNQLNKAVVHYVLEHSPLSHLLPHTILYSPEGFREMISRYPVIYLKPIYGRQGTSVYRIVSVEGRLHISENSLPPMDIWEQEEDWENRVLQRIGTEPFLIQQGIEMMQLRNHYYDLRVLVQRNRRGVWTAEAPIISRQAHYNYYNTSVIRKVHLASNLLSAIWSRHQRLELLNQLRNYSVDAAIFVEQHYGMMGEVSVDYALDRNGRPWLIEVNGMPDKRIYRRVLPPQAYRQLNRRMLEFAAYLASK